MEKCAKVEVQIIKEHAMFCCRADTDRQSQSMFKLALREYQELVFLVPQGSLSREAMPGESLAELLQVRMEKRIVGLSIEAPVIVGWMDLQADVSGFKLERLLDRLLPQGDSVGIRVLQGIRNNISEQESYQLLEYIVWWANEHQVYQLALDALQQEEDPQYKALRQIQPHIEYVHVIRDNTYKSNFLY